MDPFLNRNQEFTLLGKHVGKSSFAYVSGRRRIGKTALLIEAARRYKGLYHQAIEGSPQNQIDHLVEEWSDKINLLKDVRPKSWSEFFKILSLAELPQLIIFDEFPYWVSADATLPSILQKWVDHELPKKKTCLLVSGSSQNMLHSQFLEAHAPLYGRAHFQLSLPPMSFSWFCKALKYNPADPIAFERYSLVGGVPHYWKLMPKENLISQANTLYFEQGAPLADEPRLLLYDEGVTGNNPKTILDLVGRGVSKPSEIAGRVGVPQNHLSRAFEQLIDLNLLNRELPYGESLRTTKKTLYTLNDPALSFYYGTFLPHRQKWNGLSPTEKQLLIHNHASKIWETFCRTALGGGRYWEKDIEIDIVAPIPSSDKHIIAECKWKKMNEKEKNQILNKLEENFSKTTLAKKLNKVEFKVYTPDDLKKIAGLS